MVLSAAGKHCGPGIERFSDQSMSLMSTKEAWLDNDFSVPRLQAQHAGLKSLKPYCSRPFATSKYTGNCGSEDTSPALSFPNSVICACVFSHIRAYCKCLRVLCFKFMEHSILM